MEKFMNGLERCLLPISEKIAGNKYLQAISSAFLALFPVTITGSIFFLLANFPIPAFTTWLGEIGLTPIINIVYTVTIGLMAIYTVFLISYRLAEFNKVDKLSTGIISLICFFVLTPFVISGEGPHAVTTYSFEWLGAKGLFVAIIVGLLTTAIVTWVIKKDWTIKLPENVPPYVSKSFASIIPAFIAATIFVIIAGLFTLTSYGNVHQFIFGILQKPMMALGGSLGGYLIATILIQLLWWFGIHGFNVVGSIMIPVWMALDMERLAAIQAGQPVTNFIGMSFLTAVGQSTVAVLLTVYLVAKSNQLKQTAKIGLPAAVFNIGEPMVFGLPTVLNPFMFIPTVILLPLVTNLFMYFGFASGIVPVLSGVQIPMQMPVVLYGLVQGNWMLALWQLLAIPLSMALVYPFVKMYDKQILKQEEIELEAETEVTI